MQLLAVFFPGRAAGPSRDHAALAMFFFSRFSRKSFDVGDLQVFKVIPTSPKMKRRKDTGTAFVDFVDCIFGLSEAAGVYSCATCTLTHKVDHRLARAAIRKCIKRMNMMFSHALTNYQISSSCARPVLNSMKQIFREVTGPSDG